jgi:hypothetical protein
MHGLTRRLFRRRCNVAYLDPSVQHVGVVRLRALNVAQLRDLDKTLVIQTTINR